MPDFLSKTLVFLEFTEEAEALLKRHLKDIQASPEKFTIISFHPLIGSYLKKYNISVVESFNFCPVQSHRRLLSELEIFSENIRNSCHIKDRCGITESYKENLIFSLRGIFSTWLYRAEVISNAIEYYKPESIISVGSEKINIVKSLWTESAERYLRDILKQVCDSRNIKLEKISLGTTFRSMRWNLSKLLHDAIRYLLGNLLGYFIKPPKKLILIPSEGHNINKLLEILRKEMLGYYDIAFLGLPQDSSIRTLFKSIRPKSSAYRYLFYNTNKKSVFEADFIEKRHILNENVYKVLNSLDYRGISPARWLNLKYRLALFDEVINKTYYQSLNLSRFLDSARPIFVLSQYSTGLGAIMGEACKIRQIPSLMIPHGSFTSIRDEYSKKEWKENAIGMVDTNYKYLAIQTPLIIGFLKDVPTRSEAVVTGPLVFGLGIKNGKQTRELRRRYVKQDEKVILHAGTPKDRRNQRFINYETIDEYIDGLTSLIMAVEGIKNIHLIIRYRPLDGLEIDELTRILPKSKSYSIASDLTFIDYLSITDLLVSYSSSTMEEALQNNIPVLLFNKYNRYQHIRGRELAPESGDILPSAVYNVNSKENLKFAIQWIFQNHLPQRDSLINLFDEYKYRTNEMVSIPKFIEETVGA